MRLAALAVAYGTQRFPEFWEYDIVARNLLAGRGLRYTWLGIDRQAYAEPIYPFVVAVVYRLTDFNVWALGIFHCAVSAVLAPVTYMFASRTFGQRAGLAAGALIVIHPGLAGYAPKFHPLTFDALAIALVAFTLLRLLDTADWPSTVLFGLATGLCVLARPTILVFVAAVAVWLARYRWRRPVFRYFVFGLIVAAAVILPWVIRNYVAVGAVVLSRSHAGFNFWLGNHPGATGGEGDPRDLSGSRSLFEAAPADFRQRVLAERDEVAQNRVFVTEAIHYITEKPLDFVARTTMKFAYFWWFPPYFGKRYGTFEDAVYRAFYLGLVALAGAALVRMYREPALGHTDGVRLAILLPVSMALAHALFVVQGRHRLAVETMLVVFSGHGVAWLATCLAGRWSAWRGDVR